MSNLLISPHKNSSAFTLIEIIVVLVLIAILAAVAIPRFHSMTDRAAESSIRGTLGNVRSAISMWRSNGLASGGSAAWPAHAVLLTQVIDSNMPENPWAGAAGDSTVSNAAIAGDTKGEVDGSANGWQYDSATGDFWANSSGNSENTW